MLRSVVKPMETDGGAVYARRILCDAVCAFKTDQITVYNTGCRG